MAKAFPKAPVPDLAPSGSYAVVASKFNETYVQALLDNTLRELSHLEPTVPVLVAWAPGSFEIPLFVQTAAEKKIFKAVIALGVIIDGETAHGSLVADTVSKGLMEIALKCRVPVIHEVLFVKNKSQAKARCFEGKHNRGAEAARAAVVASRNLQKIT